MAKFLQKKFLPGTIALLLGCGFFIFGAIVVTAATTIPVYNLDPSWTAIGGGGVWSSYQGPNDGYAYNSPGATAVYNGREAAPIYAGVTVNPVSSNYEDQGLFAFKPGDVPIGTFATQLLTYDFTNQSGTNPVWVYIELNKGLPGDIMYQYVPASNPSGWHTEDAATGTHWQAWTNTLSGITTGPMLSLADIAALDGTKTVSRVYLTEGMGNSYNVSPGVGTFAWVDKVIIGDTTYDFVAPILTLTAPATATITKSASLIASTGGAATNNADVDAVVTAGLAPIAVTLENTGGAASANVRISPIGDASGHIQFWAKDTSNNWYDVNVTGWGPVGGFPVPATSGPITTNVYVISDVAGSYPITTDLVYVAGGTADSSIGIVTVNEPVSVTSPSLGAAATYAVLGGIYTNTSAATRINGDVGFTTAPATAPLGVHPNYGSGDPYSTAGTDQGTALTALNNQACTFTFGSATVLSDLTQPLAPGVYCVTGAMSIGTGGITLSTAGTYIFRSSGALNTADGSVVTLGSASVDDVFWTPTATTLGANSTFAGTVIDDSGITVGATAIWTGRALAFGGTVTTGATDTITVPGVSLPAPYLKLVVVVDGGTAAATAWQPTAYSTDSATLNWPPLGASVTVGSAESGGAFSPGTYTLSETANPAPGPDGYNPSAWSCVKNGAPAVDGSSITLDMGDSATCTITNVAKITPTVSVTNSPVTYSGSPQSATVTGSVAGIVSNVMYDGSSTVPTNAGSYAVTADFTPTDSATYNSLTNTDAGKFIINQVKPIITWTNPADITYGTALSGTQLNASTDIPGTFTYDHILGTVLPGGPAQALFSGFWPTDSTNYEYVGTIVNINVNKAALSITANNKSKIYGSSFIFGVEIVQSGLVTGDSVDNITLTSAGNNPTADVGTYSIVITPGSEIGTGLSNYDITYYDGTLTVDKADANIVVTPVAVTYDGSPHYATVSATGVLSESLGGLLDLTGITNHTNAGSYTDSWIFTGNNNYKPTSDNVSVSIARQDQTISFGTLTDKVFGDPTFDVSATGGASGEPVTFTATNQCSIYGDKTVHLDSNGTCTITAHQAGNTNYNAALDVSQSFNITDITGPVISGTPTDITVEAVSASGNVVNWTNPTAIDDADGVVGVSCVPAQGSTFPIGTTLVTCSATDISTNISTTTFNVKVEDTTAPVIALHEKMDVEATSGLGAVVTYEAPDATDNVDATAPATCTPASGSTFPMGITSVDCYKTDAAGNSATPTIFQINVQDNTPPIITVADYNTTPRNTDLEVTATTNEGTLNFPSHIFTANGSFDFVATDLAGNVATTTVTISSFVQADQTVPVTAGDGSGDVAISSTTPEVIITNPDQAVDITVENGTLNPIVNFDALITDGIGTLPETTVNSTVGSVAVEVVITDNTVVTSSDSSWNGTMLLPQIDTGSIGNAPTGFSVGGLKVEVGSPDFTLSFDKAVKITLTGVTGAVGYKPAGSNDWQTIDTQCNSATDHDNINVTSPKECYFHAEGDTIIWTYHFTTFGELDPIVYGCMDSTATNYNSVATSQTGVTCTYPSSGGGGGGVAPAPSLCASVDYDEWQTTCVNSLQYRNIKALNPTGCQMTQAQRDDAHRACQVAGVKTEGTSTTAENKPVVQPKVLGAKTYANGTLLKGSGAKIYLLVGGKKYHIKTLKELWSYRGRKTNKVTDDVLAQYLDTASSKVLGKKLYGNSALIRLQGDKKVYIIIGGAKQYIPTLEELAKYGKKKINDISAEEFAKY